MNNFITIEFLPGGIKRFRVDVENLSTNDFLTVMKNMHTLRTSEKWQNFVIQDDILIFSNSIDEKMYFAGYDVKPIEIKKNPENEKFLEFMHNYLLPVKESLFQKLWKKIKEKIPSQ